MSKKSTKNIGTAFLLNLFFSIVELVGGIFTNSIAIISDSVHDFGDAVSIAIAWGLEKKSEKEPDKVYTYGYGRYSILGALIASVILLIGSVVMVYNAIPRLFNPAIVNYDGMLGLAIFGVIINGFAAYRTAKGNTINEKAISLHLLEDVLGWIATLIVSIVMKIFEIPILDPILSIAIVIYILMHVVENVREIFEVFLEKIPEGVDLEKIEKALLENTLIKGVHHLHAWSANGTNKYMTMHIVIYSGTDKDKIIAIKNDVRSRLRDFEIEHVTIELEFEDELCEAYNC